MKTVVDMEDLGVEDHNFGECVVGEMTETNKVRKSTVKVRTPPFQ